MADVNRRKTIWVCEVAWLHELGNTDVRVYPTRDVLVRESDCCRQDPTRCRPVELVVMEPTDAVR